jgi:hypothetical protein
MDQEPLQQNQQTPEQQYPLANTPPPKPRRGLWIIIFVIAALVVAGGALGYWQYQKQVAIKNQNALIAARNNSNNSQPTSTPGDYPTDIPAVSSGIASIFQSCANSGPIIASRSGTVQWLKVQPQDIRLFASSSLESDFDHDESFLVGHFTGGRYSGGDLLITVGYFNEPGGYYWYRVARKDNKYYFLDKYSDRLPDPVSAKSVVNLSEDATFDLPDLDYPQSLSLNNPAATFTAATSFGFFQNGKAFFCLDGNVYNKVFTDPVMGDVYTDATTSITDELGRVFSSRNGFYVKAPDGTLLAYSLDIPIIGKDKVPQVTWSSGKKNNDEYSYQAIGGCGSNNFRDVADENPNSLEQIGSDIYGQPVYGFKDSNSQELQGKYSGIYVPDGQTKILYSDFIAAHPIFFWKDPFGKFVRFTTSKYQPMAECGKPVIYLYPERTEKVSVQINPLGGMFKSEPAYNSGWNVIADPQSNITNLADGKIYPYLFWEGRGGMYQTPDRGFVIKQTEVHGFLQTKLHELGLNNKESADFMQFWEPKMQSSPYYFVTFMGNSIMDNLAPLSVNPKPDTVIRILMDFKPLSQPISVEGYNIRTPERKGFTVVEWGGVLR